MIARNVGGLRATAVAPVTLITNARPYALDDPIIDSMLRAADNQPGLRLRLGTAAELLPGSLSLEFKNDAGVVLRLDRFETEAVDLDGDGTLGSDPEEAVLAFFPIAESDLITRLLPAPFSIDLFNRTGQDFELRELTLLSGAISMANSNPRAFVKEVRTNGANLDEVVSGLKDERHVLETSGDLKQWMPAAERVFADYLETFSLPVTEAAQFLRVSRP
jgi:hypothetical protein